MTPQISGTSDQLACVIPKIIISRIKPFLSSLIGQSQASFLTNRRASDNAIIGQEIIAHFGKMKGKKGHITLIIDLEKAFDRIEWSFIKETISFFKFPDNLTNLIMARISTSSMEVLVNGRKTEVFTPSKGIRKEIQCLHTSSFYVWKDFLGR